MDKFVGKVLDTTTDKTQILEATSMLAENLMLSEPFLKLKETERILSENEKATTLIAAFENLRQKIIEGQNNSKISENDIAQFRAVQMEIAENEIIQEFNLAQESAKELLKDVNQEISQILGINFATLAQRSRGCC